MAEVETVLIVGGGIAGLTLGRALRGQGFTVELVERNPVWRAEGGGIAVQPNGMRMLHALGPASPRHSHGSAGTTLPRLTPRLWHV